MPPTPLTTRIPAVTLCPFTLDDVGRYHTLLRANAAHVTRHGDYREEVALDLAARTAHFAEPGALDGFFGIVAAGALVGVIHLVPVDPPRFGLGYLLAESATGRGYAAAAVNAIVAHARDDRNATDLFAGVSHGNDKSVAVLLRTGFRPVAEFARYTRFHRSIEQPSREP